MTTFDLVRRYAEHGVHRTGTPSQAATARWLADELRVRGGRVDLEPVAFERYDADWSVSVGGTSVEALPLFYEAGGAAASDAPQRWPAFAPAVSGPLGVTGPLGDAGLVPGDLVVAATRNLLGLLAVSNRTPGRGSGVHVLQIAGEHGGALAVGAPVVASIDARLVAAECPNVVGRFGDVDTAERLVVVTTPISGWFRCAGERGTGVAVALRLVEHLADRGPVLFLGATGHELGAFGAAALRRRWADRAHTVIHVGANVGCDWEGDEQLAPPDHGYMAARLAAGPAVRDGVADAFGRVEVGVETPARSRDRWFGEAADWLDAPQLLSYLGQNPWFHTPDDLPDVSCTAARTDAVADAFTTAALRLVAN